ncbi:MAG: hypothetical protein KGZ59_00875 [Chitinophagaceae bacterium]|nr:hypothetical protein [Chitinophagaceae bacterium]
MDFIAIKETIESVLEIELTTANRKRDTVEAKIIFCAICFLIHKPKLKELEVILDKDHATILHYKKLVVAFHQYDKLFQKKYQKCIDSLSISDRKKILFLKHDYLLRKMTVKRSKTKVYG